MVGTQFGIASFPHASRGRLRRIPTPVACWLVSGSAFPASLIRNTANHDVVKITTSTTHPTSSTATLAARTLFLVQALNDTEHQALADFARTRFSRLQHQIGGDALRDLEPADLVQQAFSKTMIGMTSATEGRRPKAKSLVNTAAFLHWLRSVINSELHNARVRAAIKHEERACILDAESPMLASGDEWVIPDQVNFKLSGERLMSALREKFAGDAGALKVVALWEAQLPWASHIPDETGQKHKVHAVRQAARSLIEGLELLDRP